LLRHGRQRREFTRDLDGPSAGTVPYPAPNRTGGPDRPRFSARLFVFTDDEAKPFDWKMRRTAPGGASWPIEDARFDVGFRVVIRLPVE